MKTKYLLTIIAVFLTLPSISLASNVRRQPIRTAFPKGAVVTAPGQDSTQEDKKAEALKKYLEAQRLEKAGNSTGAIEAYKRAMELDPTSAELKVALGSLYLKNRNFIDAETQARAALKITPDSTDGEKLLASTLVAQTFVGKSVDKTKAQAAIKELESVAKTSPTAKVFYGDQEVPVLAVLAQLYMGLDDNDKARDAIKRLTQTDSTSDRAFFMLASMYLEENKYQEATDAARKAYAIKQDPQYAALLARCLANTGRTQESLTLFRKALGIKDPAENGGVTKDDDETGKSLLFNTGLIFEYARALVTAGKYDEAKKLMDPILKGASKDSDAYLRATDVVVDALRKSGQRAEAVKTIQAGLQGQDVTTSLPLLFSLAETYSEMQNFDKAIETYEEALKAILNPDGTVGSSLQDRQNVTVILTREAVAYQNEGKRDKEMATFERMRKILGPESPRPDEFEIDTYLHQDGDYKKALEASTAAIAKYPDEKQFKYSLAEAASKLGDMKKAQDTLNGLIKGTPDDASVYAFLANLQSEANMLKEAEESARKAMAADPNSIDGLVTLSIVLQREKKFKDSEAALRKALDIDPNNPTLLNNLGYYLTERGDRLQEAEQLIQRAVNIVPNNGSFLDSLGWFYFKQGKTDEAKKYLDQAVIYSPLSGTIHDHVGDLFKKLGDNTKAKAEWQKALTLSTDQDELKKIRDKLSKLK